MSEGIPGLPVRKEAPRISVAMTDDEFKRFNRLALQMNTSVSALGQLALRNMLVQADAGAMPMLPVALTAAGAIPTVAEVREEIRVMEERHLAEMNELKVQGQLLELTLLAEAAAKL